MTNLQIPQLPFEIICNIFLFCDDETIERLKGSLNFKEFHKKLKFIMEHRTQTY